MALRQGFGDDQEVHVGIGAHLAARHRAIDDQRHEPFATVALAFRLDALDEAVVGFLQHGREIWRLALA